MRDACDNDPVLRQRRASRRGERDWIYHLLRQGGVGRHRAEGQTEKHDRHGSTLIKFSQGAAHLRMIPRRATTDGPASKLLTLAPRRLLREALLAYAEPIRDIARRLANPRSWQGPNGG